MKLKLKLKLKLSSINLLSIHPTQFHKIKTNLHTHLKHQLHESLWICFALITSSPPIILSLMQYMYVPSTPENFPLSCIINLCIRHLILDHIAYHIISIDEWMNGWTNKLLNHHKLPRDIVEYSMNISKISIHNYHLKSSKPNHQRYPQDQAQQLVC